jgi:hypothetical protein
MPLDLRATSYFLPDREIAIRRAQCRRGFSVDSLADRNGPVERSDIGVGPRVKPLIDVDVAWPHNRDIGMLFNLLSTVLYSTVTDLARLRGWSTSHPRRTAMW